MSWASLRFEKMAKFLDKSSKTNFFFPGLFPSEAKPYISDIISPIDFQSVPTLTFQFSIPKAIGGQRARETNMVLREDQYGVAPEKVRRVLLRVKKSI